MMAKDKLKLSQAVDQINETSVQLGITLLNYDDEPRVEEPLAKSGAKIAE